ncbi:MAG: pilus assembly protein N-terminal domain-containing protein [Acidobacteria bacterium]|nr:pilus assembly protein N-terminal domain-containing protein [Acidobacteriota bacterium]
MSVEIRSNVLRFLGLAAACAGLAWAQSEELRVTAGKSLVIDYPADVVRISTSNPEVVDAVAVTTREILLHARALGNSTVVVWSKSGERTFYNINVEHNLEPLRRLLKETFPNENIQVQAARDSVSLVGKVSSKEVADRATALVTPLVKSVLNNLEAAAPAVEQQVVLRVKFAELNRNVSQSFGVNLISTGLGNTPGSIGTGQFGSPSMPNLRGSIPGKVEGTSSSFSISDVLNVFAFRPDLNLAGFVRALQGQGLLQILAEPNLVTTNGKEASFLVGGEFPIPVMQGGSSSGAVTVQFREFGIRLTFLPQITANGTIKMYVKPEVSTIDLANGVTISGFNIPALATRRMETNIELGEGQSFVIGGLIDDRVTESMSKIPGLAHIPILGVLFKSRQESKQRSELVVMVTPERAQPVRSGDLKALPPMPKEFIGPPVSKPAPAAASGQRGKEKKQ